MLVVGLLVPLVKLSDVIVNAGRAASVAHRTLTAKSSMLLSAENLLFQNSFSCLNGQASTSSSSFHNLQLKRADVGVEPLDFDYQGVNLRKEEGSLCQKYMK